MAFLSLTGNKSRLWTRKCGNEENVAHVLQQYKAFVSKNKIFQEFHKAFLEFKDVSEDYKNNANLSVSERTEIDKFIQDVQQKWVTLLCGSCHLDRASNSEISIEYWMIFVFLICCETHFGASLRYRKGWVISLWNLLSNSSFFFDQGVNKKVNKHSKFDANFKIGRPVQMTWYTH